MAAGSAAFRRGSASSAALVAAVALVAVGAAAGLGVRVAPDKTLPALNGSARSDARNAIGKLTPVNAQFVAARVGHVPGTPSAPDIVTTTIRPRTATPPPADPSLVGAPGTFPGLAPGGWVLTIKMVPDHTTVHAGDELRYRMIVTNTGSGDFYGRSFQLEWLTPNGTLGRNSIQQCSVLPTALVQGICAMERVLFTPGVGETRPQTFNSSGLIAIGAGQQWFKDWYVEILPSNAAGSTILNHTVLTVNINGAPQSIRTPDVVVTVA